MPSKSTPPRPNPGGYTLVEMMLVVSIIGILIGLSVSSFDKMRDNMAPRNAAMEFMSALRAAHQYSMDNSVRTRLVFADTNLPKTAVGTNLIATNSYGIYAFYVPKQPLGGTQYNGNTVGNEYSMMPTLSIPDGFVGEWMPCPIQPKWRTMSTRVVVSDISQFFAAATNMTNFYASNYYSPLQTWIPVNYNVNGANASNFFGTQTMNAVYPGNYDQTPYPAAYRLMTANVATTEASYLSNGVGGNQPYYSTSASFIWPTNVNYQYFNIPTLNTASPATNQTTATGAARTFFDLPGIEFDTRGFPIFNGTNLTFVFTEKRNTNNYYQVVIDSTVGIPRLIGPSGPAGF